MRDLLSEFIQCLDVAEETLAADIGLKPGVEEIADMLWLAQQLPQPVSEADRDDQTDSPDPRDPALFTEIENAPRVPGSGREGLNLPPQHRSVGTLTTEPNRSHQATGASVEAQPVMIPAAAALRHPLELARSLRPLIRKTESRTRFEIDEEATAIALAENNPVWVIQQPAQERWLELELVIEESKAALIWDAIAKEFIELLEQLGAFRTLRVWRLDTLTDGNGQPIPRLMSGRKSASHPVTTTRVGKPKELINATGQRLVILLTDCISPLWRQGLIHEWLAEWGRHGPAVILQWFPEPYWSRTALKNGSKVWLSALSPGISNDRMERHYGAVNPDNWTQLRQPSQVSKAIAIPVVTLEPSALSHWSRVVAGQGGAQVQGRRFKLSWQDRHWQGPVKPARPLPDSGEERFRLFAETASGIAKQLAGLMSLGPVSPEITHLIQEKLLPQSGAVHVAEVFLSGLLERTADDCYLFVPGVQEKLQKSMLKVDENLVFRVLSEYISERYGRTPREFRAFLQRHREWADSQWDEAFETSGFAELRQRLSVDTSEEIADEEEVLQTSLNDEFAKDVDVDIEDVDDDVDLRILSIEDVLEGLPDGIDLTDFPPFKTLEFEMATVHKPGAIVDPEEATDTVVFQTQTVEVVTVESLDQTEPDNEEAQRFEFEFEIATVDEEGTIQRRQGQAWEWIEDLGDDIALGMVYVPSGEFLMGTPDMDEDERPQHHVTITEFYMGRYPITQEQWRAVASLPRVNRDLDIDPSHFKGDKCPVERVSWYDAVEFCERLSRETGRAYRLPTEAEWEYACRAGTTTQYHFGETIIKELASYDRSRKEGTTPINHYGVANVFGLSDMHGNVWEWCQDHWHGSYEGAPTDGSAWLTEDEQARRVRRGGSWTHASRVCRSAFRDYINPVNRIYFNGFRVVCGVPRT